MRVREKNPRWKGGRSEAGAGYIYLRLFPDDPYYAMCNTTGRVFEHRLVMAKSLGRCLFDWEIVHHKNRNRSDNRIENLELLPNNAVNISYTLLQQRVEALERQNKLMRWHIRELEGSLP